ncbi:signal transduction histidine kinase [Stanieria sp. NIES-3757]|nr:signal transduction histidine kinase [Stanieria sp. NIES-3757]
MTTTYSDNRIYKRIVGLFYSRDEAEAAVRDLRDSGFNMNRVSVIAKDTNPIAGTEKTRDIGNKADEGAATGALTGGALGGITGLLVGLGLLAIPGIGPILLAGAEATAIATTLAGVGIGAAAGGLVGALVGLGIPEEKAKIYSDRVAGGSFLVMVNAPETEIGYAEAIMRRHGVEELEIYDSVASAPRTTTTDVYHPVSGIEPRVSEPVVNSTPHVVNMIEPGVGESVITYIPHPVSGIEPRVNEPVVTPTPHPVSDIEPRVGESVLTPVPHPISDIEPRIDKPPLTHTTGVSQPEALENVKLYEERLIINKERAKAGEIAVGKTVETEVANISIPVEKEKVIIERHRNPNVQPVSPNQVAFSEGEVARVDVYEETADIEKQAFVREEVTIRKEVAQDTIKARETIRHEELEVDVNKQPIINKDL